MSEINLVEVVVKRSEWLRGEGSHQSYLVRSSDNKMCCLGFVGVASGIKVDTMRDLSSPAECLRETTLTLKDIKDTIFGGLLSDFGNINSKICEGLMTINDRSVTIKSDPIQFTEADRERQLIESGVFAGIKFVFVD